MDEAQKLRLCRDCETVFEPEVADRDRSGAPRCPQCFLSNSDEIEDVDAREFVVRQTTPFR